jgi:hypothetical protein
MLIVLRNSEDCSLKADRSLFDPIMKFKADCPKIQEYLHISKHDSLVNTSRMRLAAFTILTSIGRLPDTELGQSI